MPVRLDLLRASLIMNNGAPPARLCGLVILAGALLHLGTVPRQARAQSNPRSTFPGRRVGGGTRGECSSRIVLHLVPESSVYAPATSADLAVVLGPAAQPAPLKLTFRAKTGELSTRTLPPSSAGLTLLRIPPLRTVTEWESSYVCKSGGDVGASADPLNFIETSFPPALSLLLPSATASDSTVQTILRGLRASCGGSVPTLSTLAGFGLDDLVTEDWPVSLPVRCPS